MKKFAKMLALGLALAMTFGMVVSAAENESTKTENPKVEKPADVTVAGDVKEVAATEEEKAAVAEAVSKVEANPSSVLPGAWLKVSKVLGTFYLEPTADKDAEIVIDVSKEKALAANENYAFLHLKDDGTVEYINLGKPVDGKLTAKPGSFSPFTLVVTSYNPPVNAGDNGTSTPAADTSTTPVSPKTGETLPVAGMMAVLCLAGALVCAKKARCNN